MDLVAVGILVMLTFIATAKPQERDNSQNQGVNHICKLPSLTEMVTLNKCLGQVGLSPEQFTESYVDELKVNGYEDQCLARCFYSEHNLITPDGSPATDSIVNWVSNAVPASRQSEAVPIALECLTSAEAQVAPYGGIPAAPCKYAVIMGLCLNDRIFEPFCTPQ